MGENMGWKVVLGTILISLGTGLQLLPGELLGPVAYLSGILITIGIALGGIGMRHSQAKIETKLDRVMVIESKVDKALKDSGKG